MGLNYGANKYPGPGDKHPLPTGAEKQAAYRQRESKKDDAIYARLYALERAVWAASERGEEAGPAGAGGHAGGDAGPADRPLHGRRRLQFEPTDLS